MELKEKYKNMRAFVVLLAALISWLLNMRYNRVLLKALVIELIVILVFYILSTIAIKLIDKIANMEVKTNIEASTTNDLSAEGEAANGETEDK